MTLSPVPHPATSTWKGWEKSRLPPLFGVKRGVFGMTAKP
jgi:hypothetical protein